MPAFFDSSDALDGFLCLIVGVIDAGLILRSLIVALPVGDRRIDHIKICQKQCVKTHFFGIVFYTRLFL